MKLSEKKTSAIILCAGKGSRTGLLYNKIFYMFGKKTVLEMTLDNFFDSSVTDITIVSSPLDEIKIRKIITGKYNVKICYGGKTRTESVRNGLNFIDKCDIVIIHDGARPYVKPNLIDKCIKSAMDYGSGIAAVKSIDTLKKVDCGKVISNIDRETAYCIQTPQAFDYERILIAYNKTTQNATDDSEIYSELGYTPIIVEGSYDNIKITSPSDLFGIHGNSLKIGTGFDVHETREGRALILGGENIPHTIGLDGHSDADVLIHAIMDALLSAANLPDIGVLFPNTDPKYKDISSIKLLKNVKSLLDQKGINVCNLSSVIIAEKPKLNPFIDKMKNNIAAALDMNAALINISATTAETLGMIGEEKGIAASAVCLLDILVL